MTTPYDVYVDMLSKQSADALVPGQVGMGVNSGHMDSDGAEASYSALARNRADMQAIALIAGSADAGAGYSDPEVGHSPSMQMQADVKAAAVVDEAIKFAEYIYLMNKEAVDYSKRHGEVKAELAATEARLKKDPNNKKLQADAARLRKTHGQLERLVAKDQTQLARNTLPKENDLHDMFGTSKPEDLERALALHERNQMNGLNEVDSMNQIRSRFGAGPASSGEGFGARLRGYGTQAADALWNKRTPLQRGGVVGLGALGLGAAGYGIHQAMQPGDEMKAAAWRSPVVFRDPRPFASRAGSAVGNFSSKVTRQTIEAAEALARNPVAQAVAGVGALGAGGYAYLESQKEANDLMARGRALYEAGKNKLQAGAGYAGDYIQAHPYQAMGAAGAAGAGAGAFTMHQMAAMQQAAEMQAAQEAGLARHEDEGLSAMKEAALAGQQFALQQLGLL